MAFNPITGKSFSSENKSFQANLYIDIHEKNPISVCVY